LKDDFNEDTLKEVFESIDGDKDGELDVKEFGTAIL
jgi:Ca2+-binding EF-hand superfamily protein